MDKMLYLAILLVLGVFFMKKMVKPPVGPSYRLKSIFFTTPEARERYFYRRRKICGPRSICLRTVSF